MYVFILRIEDRNGADVYACATEAIVKRELENYVREWWGFETNKKPPSRFTPDDIKEYFRAAHESYELFVTELIEN